ncbi:hypothetical protein [Nostoc sp.]|uniref:hypothetical protein n=1 Tax=Nostoc sp. TaxID=1180 RepID=UPI002FFBCF5C
MKIKLDPSLTDILFGAAFALHQSTSDTVNLLLDAIIFDWKLSISQESVTILEKEGLQISIKKRHQLWIKALSKEHGMSPGAFVTTILNRGFRDFSVTQVFDYESDMEEAG